MMSSETETDRGANWMLADDCLRRVVDGETGERMRDALLLRLDGLAEAVREGDEDRYIDEVTDHASGGLFPYTYDMAQAWAESIHHVSFEAECALATPDDTFSCVVIVVQEIMRRALLLAADELRE